MSTPPVTVDEKLVQDLMIARMAKQNNDLVREIATLEAYVRLLHNQIAELSKGAEENQG